MDPLVLKTISVSRGFTYKYYATASSTQHPPSQPALLFLHGFRDTATCWRQTVQHLHNASFPYRLVIPDTLGHGGSSRPKSPSSYAYHLMVQDMLDIISAEGIELVIPVGHDHGSVLAQRIYNHFPDKVAGIILLNVAYSPPNKQEAFNLVKANAASNAAFGYGMLEYWNFLTAPDAAGLMMANLDRVWEIPHASTFDEMKALYGVPNAMREYLADRSIPSVKLKSYAYDAELQAEWRAEIEKGGIEAPLCWFTAHVKQVQFESDQKIADANIKVNAPTLFIGCGGDAPCRLELIYPPKEAGLLPKLTVHVWKDVGHWPMYEKPRETAEAIAEFCKGNIA